MRSAYVLMLALLPQETPPKPAPPAAGSGVHVTSHLSSSLSVRFTAAGKFVREWQQSVEEQTRARIAVVRAPAEGLAQKTGAEAADSSAREITLKPEDMEKVVKLASAPPFVRVCYDRCIASFPGSIDSDESPKENEHIYLVERNAPDAPLRELFDLHVDSQVDSEVAARVRTDADAFLTGPRLAPYVLGRTLAKGSELDVPVDALAPLVAQAVRDGTLQHVKLTFRDERRDGALDTLVFAVALQVEWKSGGEVPVAAIFDLAGELVLVKTTAQFLGVDVGGPIRCSGTSDQNGEQIEVAGTGKLEFHYRAEPDAAK